MGTTTRSLAGLLGRLGIRLPSTQAEAGARDATAGVDEGPNPAAELAHQTAATIWGDIPWLDPDIILRMDLFRETAERLASDAFRVADVEEVVGDSDKLVSCLALSALVGRRDTTESFLERAPRRLRRAVYAERRLLLDLLAGHDGYLVAVLGNADDELPREWLADFLTRRAAAGERLDEDALESLSPAAEPAVSSLLSDYSEDLPDEYVEALSEWRTGLLDPGFFRGYGRVWEPPFDRPAATLAGERELIVEAIREALAFDARRSILLVGEHGVGKTALLRAALDGLSPVPFVFEANASGVNAGAIYVGQLEGRVEELARRLEGRDAVWVFPSFEESLTAGAFSGDPRGLLDALLPHVEAGTVAIAGEISPGAYAKLVELRPRLTGAFTPLLVRPLDETDTLVVAEEALEAAGLEAASEGVLSGAFDLAQQFLPGSSAPGSVLRLVRAGAAEAAEDGRRTIAEGDLLAALARASGLPLVMLDPEAALSLQDVRAFFESRIVGQPEAVDAVVERIALVKAGLADPTRPLGVFLFVGPTGTGKTELAKALAEFLFGSAERLVRLDMSEFRTPESLERLLADRNQQPEAAPLIAAVRREPFSVVLLDEFEKSAEPVWDLFLQLFDDGRLTDRSGRTCDFRRTIVILTSNVGSSLATRAAIGFERDREPFRDADVDRALRSSFRPEFLNRLDRVIVFRPLDRSQMRTLLEKELEDVLRRRGLRDRPWAVEWDDSALDFLIESGFSPEFGARPLKRAVERHVLTPLAATIVERAVPAGDQFLFLSAPGGERIEVTFVDPDAPAEESEREPAPEAVAAGLTLAGLVLSPRADEGAVGFLAAELGRVDRRAQELAVPARKAALLAAAAQEGFWDDPERFGILAEAEYLDRFEAALATAFRFRERLGRGGNGRARVAELLAGRLYVLDAALDGIESGRTPDALVRVRAAGDPAARGFAGELAVMYAGWAERRGMRLERIENAEADGGVVLAVSGLGARVILEDEEGLHVLERDGGDERVAASVVVAPWEPGPATDRQAFAEAAVRALANRGVPDRVVRRYRKEPSPLVRDSVRGYRSGKLERILAGDFDVAGG